jgi:hypothetical protein
MQKARSKDQSVLEVLRRTRQPERPRPCPYRYTGVSLSKLVVVEDSQFSNTNVTAYALFVKIMATKIKIF